ncbi:RNA polymerase sigma factor [Brevundimonas sp. SORGH_AS_0993]|uniref:RNA polymerase sigma factor n=1 Tax=Brevundimonas sp. SORGH_AS_0993 TaxID=3041794 RepID=UPI00278B7D18|nr:RNA polymerase sigma factor [Brevundimonas sp. SORGH_AS_0993]MDQ1155150.1 RNA polymerase sigma factor (sigma-70 family) [Brevundimonas sp. SORGH_AS_0993]
MAQPADIDDLARRLGGPLARYFGARVRRGADVEDLVQEVFLRLTRRTEAEAVGNWEGYVFAIANSVLADTFRREGRRIPQLGAVEPWTATLDDRSPERIYLAREEIDTVVRGLLELPEKTRFVFVLNRYEDLTYREIAGRLGLSVSAVEKHMMRALAHLTRLRDER